MKGKMISCGCYCYSGEQKTIKQHTIIALKETPQKNLFFNTNAHDKQKFIQNLNHMNNIYLHAKITVCKRTTKLNKKNKRKH